MCKLSGISMKKNDVQFFFGKQTTQKRTALFRLILKFAPTSRWVWLIKVIMFRQIKNKPVYIFLANIFEVCFKLNQNCLKPMHSMRYSFIAVNMVKFTGCIMEVKNPHKILHLMDIVPYNIFSNA